MLNQSAALVGVWASRKRVPVGAATDILPAAAPTPSPKGEESQSRGASGGRNPSIDTERIMPLGVTSLSPSTSTRTGKCRRVYLKWHSSTRRLHVSPKYINILMLT